MMSSLPNALLNREMDEGWLGPREWCELEHVHWSVSAWESHQSWELWQAHR